MIAWKNEGGIGSKVKLMEQQLLLFGKNRRP